MVGLKQLGSLSHGVQQGTWLNQRWRRATIYHKPIALKKWHQQRIPVPKKMSGCTRECRGMPESSATIKCEYIITFYWLNLSLPPTFSLRCSTFTADMSRVQNEELGSGGYCVPKRQRYPQYKYCCDLEQYFTLPDGNETPRQDINFPRCRSMNLTRNYI